MMPTTAIAVILARAGSKGVPGKNMARVGGRPCLAWTVDAAHAAITVGPVIVSSDSPAMLRLARSMDALPIERPAALAADRATVDDAARHAIGHLERYYGGPAHPRFPIVILYGNVPIRPAGSIDEAVRLLVKSGCDSVQSYAPVGKFHPWWTARVDAGSGRVKPWEGRTLNHGVFRRQDLPAAFIPDGGVLAVTRQALFGLIRGVRPGPHAFLGKDRRGVISSGPVVDIDEPIDLVVADAMLRRGTKRRV